MIKYQCIDHYEKRVGNRMRKLRLRITGLCGKGKLKKTDSDMVIKSKQIAKSRLNGALKTAVIPKQYPSQNEHC